jgi:hypothetical protein
MKNSGWIEDSTSEFCSPVLIIPKGLPHKTTATASSLTYDNWTRGLKVSNIWFPNWEKCGRNFEMPNLFRNLICVTGFGKWAFIPTAGTKQVSHANTEHFNIAFCQWASLQLQPHFSAGWKDASRNTTCYGNASISETCLLLQPKLFKATPRGVGCVTCAGTVTHT